MRSPGTSTSSESRKGSLTGGIEHHIHGLAHGAEILGVVIDELGTSERTTRGSP